MVTEEGKGGGAGRTGVSLTYRYISVKKVLTLAKSAVEITPVIRTTGRSKKGEK